MADAFDRTRYLARLSTRRLGRALRVLERTASTNDDAWDAFRALGDGAAVIARTQTHGRGRAGRGWTQVPGRGLALSVALRLGGGARHAGLAPLAAGLAVARAAHALGVPRARLKWPNDVLVEGRKLAGVLCEVRGAAAGAAVVIGVGMNVGHARDEFPAELRERATSLALEGSPAGLEDAAAEVLGRLEASWDELAAGGRAAVLAEWTRWGAHWGERMRVETPAGPLEGVALRLDADGGLVLGTDEGAETTVLAGDAVPAREAGDAA